MPTHPAHRFFLASLLLLWLSGAAQAQQSAPPDVQALPHALGQIKVTWTDVTQDEEGFVLRRSDSSGPWTVVADTTVLGPDATEFIDTIGEVRERYTYQLASSHAGVLSPWSASSSAVPVFRGKPFHGWLDVTDYTTCQIEGVSDPHPIQCAIEDLGGKVQVGPAKGPHVLYFPSGQYLVDRTLWLEGRAGVQFIGESPGSVVLQWTGPPGNGPDDTVTLFHAEGNRDSTWRNLIWDGGCSDPANCFVVAFDQSHCGVQGSPWRSEECVVETLGWPESDAIGTGDSGGAHLDSTFRRGYIGLRIGHYGAQDDTSTMRRSRFEDNFVGVSVEDYNALRHWFWDDLFQRNFVAIANDIALVRYEFDPSYRPGTCTGPSGTGCLSDSECESGSTCEWTPRQGGDFDITRGRFVDNVHTDVWALPSGRFTIRDSWSTGSGRFFFGAGLNAVPGNFALIRNQVWNDAGPAIDIRTPGAFLLLDNSIYTDPASPVEPVVLDSVVGLDPAYPDAGAVDLLAVANSYSSDLASPYGFRSTYRSREFGDQTAAAAPPVAIPALPTPVDILEGRPVYTVTDAILGAADANAARIQATIDAALADPLPSIVHFPSGAARYVVGQTLKIPAGSDLVLVGDGAWTTLWWVGEPGQPLLEIDADAVDGLTVRDLQFLDAGIVVQNLQSRATMSRLRAAEAGIAAVAVEGLDRTPVEFLDLMASNGLFAGEDSRGAVFKFGTTEPGAPEPPGVSVWGGNTNRNAWDYEVIDGETDALVLISGNYTENSHHHLRVRGPGSGGNVTVHGGKMASLLSLTDPTNPDELAEATAMVSLEDFSGNVSLVSSSMFVQPESTDEAVAHGARVRFKGSEPAAIDVQSVGLLLQRQPRAVDPDDALQDSPEIDLSAAAPNELEYLRFAGKRALPTALPLDEINLDETSDPLSPRRLGKRLKTWEEEQLLEGLHLLRTLPSPGHYDEVGANGGQQIIFDKVFVFQPPGVGLLLAGGTSCFSASDCDDGVPCTRDECDLDALPPGVPGLCTSIPEDSLCDDGDFCSGEETCGASGCLAGTPPCEASSCDEVLDVCTLTCDGDAVCEVGEDCASCPEDCFESPGGVCGNGVCEPSLGEDCLSCGQDCQGKQGGKPASQYCCGDGDGTNPVGCADARCTNDERSCSDTPIAPSCCGDGICEGTESNANCAVDCPAGFCGDGSCDTGEDLCSCAADCGTPPGTEIDCADGIDDDCDLAVDCGDPDCATDPACQVASCNEDGICDPGEDCENCSSDCEGISTGSPSGRHCCGNGVLEDPEADNRCDGNP